METWQVEVAVFLAAHFWPVACAAGGVVSLWIRHTYRAWTRNRYLGEALERLGHVNSSRERASIERVTERLLKSFYGAPRPTLESLANDTETPWNLTPSTGSFPKRER